ncbi:helix-turn-helix domain-containing protein [Weissella kandleri]|uniref:helix-turn-helix domain-containing protein n=1 Tax=Weissella kandleri TaxID=1616 RepID=UPI00387E87FA
MIHTNKMSIGTNIKQQRKKSNLSQEKLAELSNISTNYLSRIKRSTDDNMSVHVLISIANSLDTNIIELIDLSISSDSKTNIKIKQLNNEIFAIDKDKIDNVINLIIELVKNINY